MWCVASIVIRRVWCAEYAEERRQSSYMTDALSLATELQHLYLDFLLLWKATKSITFFCQLD